MQKPTNPFNKSKKPKPPTLGGHMKKGAKAFGALGAAGGVAGGASIGYKLGGKRGAALGAAIGGAGGAVSGALTGARRGAMLYGAKKALNKVRGKK